MRVFAISVALVVVSAATSAAQSTVDRRRVVFADAGYATTADDEGLLGRGVALSGGAGWRLTPRLTLQAVLDRIPYSREAPHLAFDGRVLFAGIEAAVQSTRPRVRPFVTVGLGVMNDKKRWTHKTQIGPDEYRVDDVTDYEYTLATLRSSVGIDLRVSDAASIRTGLRFHGLLDTGDDLAAHVILQPTLGIVRRW